MPLEVLTKSEWLTTDEIIAALKLVPCGTRVILCGGAEGGVERPTYVRYPVTETEWNKNHGNPFFTEEEQQHKHFVCVEIG